MAKDIAGKQPKGRMWTNEELRTALQAASPHAVFESVQEAMASGYLKQEWARTHLRMSPTAFRRRMATLQEQGAAEQGHIVVRDEMGRYQSSKVWRLL